MKIFIRKLAVHGMYNILHKFEFRPDDTTDYGVSCHRASKKSMATFSLLLLIRSSHKDMHKILDEFEFQPDLSTYCGFTCHCVFKLSHSPIMGK